MNVPGSRTPPRSSMAVAAAAALVPALTSFGLSMLSVPGGLSWLAAAVLGIGLGVLWYRRFDRHFIPLVGAVAASLIVPIIVLGFGPDALREAAGLYPEVPLARVTATDADVVAVPDGEVRGDLLGEDLPDETASTRGLPRYFYAAPFVQHGWTSTEAIAAWVECQGEGDDPRASCEEAFTHRPQVGHLTREAPQDDVAVSEALRAHALHSPGTVTIVHTAASGPSDAWFTVLAVGAFVLAVTIILVVLAERRSRPGQTAS